VVGLIWSGVDCLECRRQAGKTVRIQEVVAELAVEAIDEGTLRPFAELDET